MHVMIDLETLSTKPNAAIISLGAVEFDLTKLTLGREFYAAIDANSAVAHGGHIDISTVKWWMSQTVDAKKVFEGTTDIGRALCDFGFWLRQSDIEGVWGNGASFDNVILRTAYGRLGMSAPWAYRLDRCFRTWKAMHPQIDLPQEGTAHNALDDARWQAKYMLEVEQRIHKDERWLKEVLGT